MFSVASVHLFTKVGGGGTCFHHRGIGYPSTMYVPPTSIGKQMIGLRRKGFLSLLVVVTRIRGCPDLLEYANRHFQYT